MGKKLTEDESLYIIKQIAFAFVTIDNLKILNAQGKEVTVMHRDIKPANILFHKGQVKIADFGFAKLVDKVDQTTRKKGTILGTPLYMAPQLLDEVEYSAKCDVWSTGVMLYQLLFTKLPWVSDTMPNLYKLVQKGVEFPSDVAVREETKDLLKRMLEFKDEDRISWKEVFEHAALQNILVY